MSVTCNLKLSKDSTGLDKALSEYDSAISVNFTRSVKCTRKEIYVWRTERLSPLATLTIELLI